MNELMMMMNCVWLIHAIGRKNKLLNEKLDYIYN